VIRSRLQLSDIPRDFADALASLGRDVRTRAGTGAAILGRQARAEAAMVGHRFENHVARFFGSLGIGNHGSGQRFHFPGAAKAEGWANPDTSREATNTKRSAPSRAAAGRAASKPRGESRRRKGYLDEPLRTQPGNAPQDRMSGRHGEHRADKRWKWVPTHGRADAGGFSSSYRARSILAQVRNPLTRVRLTMPGLFAVLAAQQMNEDADRLDRVAVEQGAVGGFRSLSTGDQVKIMQEHGFGVSDSAMRFLRRSAGLVSDVVSGVTMASGLLANQFLGGSSRTAADFVVQNLTMRDAFKSMVGLGPGRRGIDSGRAMVAIAQDFGSYEAMLATIQQAEQYRQVRANHKAQIEDIAAQVTLSIVGVDGNQIYESLWHRSEGARRRQREWHYKSIEAKEQEALAWKRFLGVKE